MAAMASEMAKLGLVFNFSKCEFFSYGGAEMPSYFSAKGFKKASGCIKVLGVYIGEKEAVARKLLDKLAKHKVFFERLKAAGPLPATLAILTKCGVPRQTYQIRTHTPDVTSAVCAEFDDAVSSVVSEWLKATLSSESIDLLRLPMRCGGLGVRSTAEIAGAAYAASHSSALPNHTRPAPSQDTAQKALDAARVQRLQGDKVLARHLLACTLPQASACLSDLESDITSDEFRLILLLRLRAVPIEAAEILSCPACPTAVFAPIDAMHHVLGCTRLRGDNATTKHHSIVAFLAGLCREAGLMYEVEPRNMQSYKCQVCLRTFQNLDEHPASCKGAPHRSGPDLLVHWPAGSVYYDYTTVHEMAPSNQATAVRTLADRVISEKVKKYCGTVAAPGPLSTDAFMAIPAYSLGGLHANTRGLLADLAHSSGRTAQCVFSKRKP